MVGGEAPAPHQCFTSRSLSSRAAPQCISGRTSYLRFRLAFHPYPQVIRALCNGHRCGPPCPITGTSACPWVAQAVSGLPDATAALFRLAFAVAPASHCLNLPRRVTRRIILQKARRQPDHEWSWAFDCMEANGFRIYFTPLAGVLFTVPSRYCALSVTVCSSPWGVGSPASHALARGACYSRTRCSLVVQSTYPTITVCGAVFQTASVSHTYPRVNRQVNHPLSYNPVLATTAVLAPAQFGPKSPVRSPLLREYCYFLGLLRCFSSPGSLRKKCGLPTSGRGCPIRR